VTSIDHDELLVYVLARLEDDRAVSDLDDRLDNWCQTASPADIARWQIERNYEPAKQRARSGDFGPLLKLLTAFDPDLASLIVGKRQKRRRRKLQLLKAMQNQDARDRADVVRRVRELIEEKIEARPGRNLVVEIAAKVLKCETEIISKIIHRGIRR
jgi:hypothetical protein